MSEFGAVDVYRNPMIQKPCRECHAFIELYVSYRSGRRLALTPGFRVIRDYHDAKGRTVLTVDAAALHSRACSRSARRRVS